LQFLYIFFQSSATKPLEGHSTGKLLEGKFCCYENRWVYFGRYN